MTASELIWFAGLSIFGGSLGCAAASAHRLVTSLPAKVLLSLAGLILTLNVLMIGVVVFGYGFAVASFALENEARIELTKIGSLAAYASLIGTYLAAVTGYFSVVAYGVGLILCAVLQRVGRTRRHSRTIPAA